MKMQINQNQQEEIAGIRPEFPYDFHRNNLSTESVPWHWHEAFEFLYIVQGTLKLMADGKNYVVHQGEVFFVNSNVLHSIENMENAVSESFQFDPVLLTGYYKSIYETKYVNPILQSRQIGVVCIPGKTEAEKRIISNLHKMARLSRQEDTEFQIRNVLSEIWLLLIEVIRQMPQPEPVRSIHQERVQQMILYIQAHYAEKLTLDEIASSAALGKRECLRCFQNCIHESPVEYLLGYRIDRSKTLLRSTDLPVTEIALQCGFSGSAYFAKIFRRSTGMTPTAYRKAQKKISAEAD